MPGGFILMLGETGDNVGADTFEDAILNAS